MKKFALIAAVGLMLSVTSCIKDDERKMETSYIVPTYSLVTDSKGNTSISTTTYSFSMDLIAGTSTVGIENLILDGVTTSVTTRSLPVSGYNLVLGDNDSDKWGAACYLVEAQDATADGGRPITNFMADITTAANTLNPILTKKLESQLRVDTIVYPASAARISIYCETQYTVEDYKVMTFWCDMLYTGTTSRMGASSVGPDSDNNGVIRVYLDLKKASEYKATVYFYNFKKTTGSEDEQATSTTVDFKIADLPVTFDGSGFRIQGSGLVPVSLTGDVQMSEYVMNDFVVGSRDNMTGITCHFMQADNTVVSFVGTGVYGYNKPDIK